MTSVPPWRVRPDERPAMHHSWRRLLFLHWRCEPHVVQERLPAGLTVDTFDGSAWLGIVPFEMRRIRPSWSPVVPYVSNFLELNLRTYVRDECGTPGVWFISLNANRFAAVWFGRSWFRLPYFWSQMKCVTDGEGWIEYSCRRFSDPNRQSCRWRYRPLETPNVARDGTLDHFLIERYILFTRMPSGRIASGQVYHMPYSIQPAEVKQWDDRLFALDGFAPPGVPPEHVVFSPGVDVEVFRLREIG